MNCTVTEVLKGQGFRNLNKATLKPFARKFVQFNKGGTK